MKQNTLMLKENADKAKNDYYSGIKTREEALKKIEKYTNEINKVGKEISKKYKRKFRNITALEYMR